MIGDAGTIGRSTDQALDQLLESLTTRIQSGEFVDVEACIAAHPEFADQLRRVLPAMQMLVAFGASVGNGPRIDSAIPPGGPTGVLGDFRIGREIGRGGMGVVYEAEQISLGRRVALKVLPFASMMGESQTKRFQNEARSAAALDHPNIVSIYSVGCERGVHYFSMRLVDGCNLADVIQAMRDRQALPINAKLSQVETVANAAISTLGNVNESEYCRSIARLGMQAAEALHYAHQQGVVHRDIKPANLLLDAHGRIYVSDFGLAQLDGGASVTRSGDLLGTLRYMSPEQALGKHESVGARSDIYSLGATLYELLTLEPAITATNHGELMQQLNSTRIKPLRAWNRHVPADLETIVLGSLDSEPAHRYASAADVADDLRRFLDHKSIRRRPPSARQKLTRWISKHQALTVTIAAALVVTLIATQLVTAFSLHARALAQRESVALTAERAYNRAAMALICERFNRLPTPTRSGDTTRAIPSDIHELYQHALAARQTLADENPESRNYRLDIAISRASYAVLLAQYGDSHGAEREAVESLKILDMGYEALVDEGSLYSVFVNSLQAEEDCRRMACAVLRSIGKTHVAIRYAQPFGMVISDHGYLYISSRGLDSILKIALSDGRVVDELRIPDGLLSPHGLAMGPDGCLYVCSEFTDRIVRFDETSGSYLGVFIPYAPHPVGIAIAPNGRLFVTCHQPAQVQVHDGTTGSLIDSWKHDGGDRLRSPTGMAFAANGDLLVACSSRVERYDPMSGEFQGVFAAHGGPRAPIDLALGSEGKIFVLGTNAAYSVDDGSARPPILIGLPKEHNRIEGIATDRFGNLYLNSINANVIVRIDARTGALAQIAHTVE